MPDAMFFLIGLPAVAFAGLSKGGFAGAGMISTPLMALVLPPVEAAAVILPVLVLQDAVGLWKFRHHVDRRNLARLAPGAAAGILAGYLMAASLSPKAVALGVGMIALAYGLRGIYRTIRPLHSPAAPRGANWPRGLLAGAGAGFTSMIANAGAPPVQIYLLPQALPRDVFIGTSTVFFALVNWAKLPAFMALGQFTGASLLASALLAPVAVLATLAGVALARRVPQARFYFLIQCLMALVGAKLLWDALS